jgi:molybdate transport system permease protein
MKNPATEKLSSPAALLALLMVLFLLLPLVALGLSSSPSEIQEGMGHPLFLPALLLSLRTTLVSLALTLLLGTPLAWWLAHSKSNFSKIVGILVELPIVIPPAVIGIALLQTFGAQGLLGPSLEHAGLHIPFTESAVVLAQVVVSAPFYVKAAQAAFLKVDSSTLLVARSLGATPREAFFNVALPIARPGLVIGASLAWSRALGEFGATLLFAGSLSGETQTLPLAIFAAMESDVRLAVVFSLVLAAIGALLLAALRFAPLRTVSKQEPA